MIKPKLNFVVLCDAVGHGPDGKKTLYGLFNRIVAREFPHAHPSLAIVTRWSCGVGPHSMHLRIVDSDKTVVFEPTGQCTFTLEHPLASADVVLNVAPLMFPRPGTYWIQVLLDGRTEEVEEAIFVDRLPAQPHPAPRPEE